MVGDEIVGHPHVAAVGFIGSTATGNAIAQRAAGKALLLEMGGNGPLVVLDDADLEAAADAAIIACFLCAGQSCTAGERLLVHEAVREDFVARLAERRARDRPARRPARRGHEDGPAEQRAASPAKMDEHVRDAVERGATVVTGGARAGGFPTDLYWPATILDRVPPTRAIGARRRSGRSRRSSSIGSLDEAIELANGAPYGLLAAVSRPTWGLRFADEVRAGLVNINETTNYWENHLPFGGRAGTDSGTGRVGGATRSRLLTELQTVVIGAS